MLITISGTPGSGKTTVARLLAAKLGLPHVYAGDLFREEARRLGLSLPAFTARAECDHSIDRALDEKMAAYARQGNLILEGRLAAFMARQEGVPALKVWLYATAAVRARRVAEREGTDWREVLEANHLRQRSDAKRYWEIYGFDLNDTSIYDLRINTDDQTPESIAAHVFAAAAAQFGPRQGAS